MFKVRLKILRRQYGLTQSQLAEKLGISTSTIGMYEQGRRTPNHKTLLSICRLFKISIDYLLEPEDKTENKKFCDFNDIIAGFERNLLEQDGLMFNGIVLRHADVKKIVNAMKIGAEIATRESPKKKIRKF